MKNIFLLFALGTFLVLGITSCDVIEPPYKKQPITGGGDTSQAVKKVLIEDFTGFKCQNCPKAAVIARDLQAVYGDRLVVMAVHAGFYSEPDVKHTYDFRTSIGTYLDGFFKMGSLGYPNGLVNRIMVSGSRILAPDSWGDQVDRLLKEEPEVTLQLKSAFNAVAGTDTVTVNMRYLKPQDADNYLVVCVVEDSIVQYQLDGKIDIPDYVHNHVLRSGINGNWGDPVSPAKIGAGDTFTRTYVAKMDGSWRPEHCKIVAYIHKYNDSYDISSSANREFEVLQAEEVSLIK